MVKGPSTVTRAEQRGLPQMPTSTSPARRRQAPMWAARFCLPAFWLLFFVATPIAAEIESMDNWELTGFGTIGYSQASKYQQRTFRRNVYQDGNRLRDDPLLTDSRFGVQLSGSITSHLEFSSQIVARHQLSDNLEDHIRFFFARYHLNDEWQISVGRQAFDLFFLSDHSDVGYSYDWVRPPTEFYGFIPYDSLDGFKVIRDWGNFDSRWQWNMSVGNTKSKFESGATVINEDNELATGKPVYGTELSWRSDNWQWRANIALINFKQEVDNEENLRALTAEITPVWPDFQRVIDDFVADTVLRYAAIGMSWQANGWKIQSEISLLDANFVNFNGERAYFHLARRYHNWLPFVTVGYAHDANNNRYLPPDPATGLLPLYRDITEEVLSFKHNQHSLTLGVRWDFTRKKALKLQCDRFFFKAQSGSLHSRLDEQYPSDETRTWCSAAFDWVF